MKKQLVSIGFFLGIFATGVVAQENYNALPWKMSTAYNSYLMREVHQQFTNRREALDKAFTSKRELLHYQKEFHQRYGTILGDFPEKSPLNAKVIGIIQQKDFRIEKIIFESIPGRYVTANLYIPEGKKKYPVAIELCGHSLNGKAPVSSAAILMVRNGIAVFILDPLGQGERLQLIDERGKALTRGVTTEHTLLNAGCNLVGSSLAAQEYRDNHRAVDYLTTREDIDTGKIGVYGSSGGGTQAAYMIGMDNRIQVAAICSFFSQRERVMELQGPSDGCQHIPYEGREQIEVADLAMMMAPKPVLILSGKYDFVDLWGAQQGFKELQKAYTVLGVKENVDMLTVETGHGLGHEKQLRLVAWFKQWLCNDKTPVKPAGSYNIPSTELLCTSTGQVNTGIKESISLMQANHLLVKQYAASREEFRKQSDQQRQAKVLELLGISLPKGAITIDQTGHEVARDYQLYKYQIIRNGEMPVPCLVLVPDKVNPNEPVVLQLNEDGKDAFVREYENIAPYITQGTILVVADLRGCGETTDPASYNDAKYWNREYRNAMISMHIGHPIMGQRVIDLLSTLDFISTQEPLKGHAVKVIANGLYGPVTIHAAFLDKRIQQVVITKSIKSFDDYVQNPMQRDMYSNVLYGVLKYYDLNDLIKLSGRPISFAD